MKMSCVPDHAIQKYVFNNPECDAEIIKHIEACEECKMSVENYLLLSKAIKEQPAPVLEFDPIELVFEQLTPAAKKEPIYSKIIYTFLVLSAVIVSMSVYVFKGSFSHFFSNTTLFPTYFILSIAILIMFILCYDLLRSFNKKAAILNY